MRVILLNALEIFEDDNEGLHFGIQDNSDFPFYCEWFKTEEEREDCINKNKFEVLI